VGTLYVYIFLARCIVHCHKQQILYINPNKMYHQGKQESAFHVRSEFHLVDIFALCYCQHSDILVYKTRKLLVLYEKDYYLTASPTTARPHIQWHLYHNIPLSCTCHSKELKCYSVDQVTMCILYLECSSCMVRYRQILPQFPSQTKFYLPAICSQDCTCPWYCYFSTSVCFLTHNLGGM
jgi:hypothetical protein